MLQIHAYDDIVNLVAILLTRGPLFQFELLIVILIHLAMKDSLLKNYTWNKEHN